MNRQTVRTKSYKTILALAGAAIIAAMPVAAEANSLPDITSVINFWDDQGPGIYMGNNFFLEDVSGTYDTGDYGPFNVLGDTISLSGSFGTYDLAFNYTEHINVAIVGHITQVLTDSADVYEFLFDTGNASDLFGGKGKTTITKWTVGDGDQSYTYGMADTVAAPVPEPATMSLMLVGGSALVAFRRRRSPITE